MHSQLETGRVSPQVVTEQPRSLLNGDTISEPVTEVTHLENIETGNEEEEKKKRQEVIDVDAIEDATYCCFMIADDCNCFCLRSLCQMLGHCCAGIGECTDNCCEGCASCLTGCCESSGDNDGCCTGDSGGDCAGCLDCCTSCDCGD